MLGPVEVAGAEPGDVVECSITRLRTIGWGWNSFPLGVGALPQDFAAPYVHYFRFDDARTTADRSVLLIVEPAAPIAIRTATIITQTLRRAGGSWRISRRTVAAASPVSDHGPGGVTSGA